MSPRLILLPVLLGCVLAGTPRSPAATDAPAIIGYTGDGSDLQQALDDAPAGATVFCQNERRLTIATTLVIRHAMTLENLNARLPEKLGGTRILSVEAKGVTLRGLELHGNYDSVPQDQRAPLVEILAGDFTVEQCRFYDATKEGLAVAPQGGEDVAGGVIRNILGHRLGRDAVSLSGGDEGGRVRDVLIENVTLKKSYLRGAVEVSDGTDNITVRNVHSEDAIYAVDVQDHGKPRQINTRVTIENVVSINSRHIVRTANSDFGHRGLILRNLAARNCPSPLAITHTSDVVIENVTIRDHTGAIAPVKLTDCRDVSLRNATIQSAAFKDAPVAAVKCGEITTLNVVSEN